ncbi:MAG: histidine phosphatase family protein [Candidatus Cloacimonadales bacterium]|jgi:broad specificity phosphatase PhoE|nr:histidine phosphatase family protein [Candidatus Cloacimonadota bacterium]MDD2650220.1 histidine phosphatase family protein [Candidatus Cloacimonadota bacterium]MDD3501543.1 histidine phosphatase family protein [Candidatus Cloacimonadota bacterium]MDX9978293.1 histidine phosphatase family protein [Candidatus Cloacimonadales bacterium]
MKIYILRHGEAEHLLEDWKKKISYDLFVENIYRWNNSQLTDYGKEQCRKVAKELEGKYNVIFSSPIDRTKETAILVNTYKRPIFYEDTLKEIVIEPPKILKRFKFSSNQWIAFCFFKTLFSKISIRLFNEVKELYSLFYLTGENEILVVSHSARIHALLLFTLFSKFLKVRKRNTKPSGVSIVEVIIKAAPIKQKGTAFTDA